MEPVALLQECVCDGWGVYDEYGEPKPEFVVYGADGEGGWEGGGGDEEGDVRIADVRMRVIKEKEAPGR